MYTADDSSQDRNDGLQSTETSTRSILGDSILPSSENGAYQPMKGGHLSAGATPRKTHDVIVTPRSRRPMFLIMEETVQGRNIGSLSSEQNSKAIVKDSMYDAKEILADHLVFDILCATDLHPIIAVARQDPDIESYELRYDFQHLTESFGQSLLSEVRDLIGKQASVALQGALSSKLVAFAVYTESRRGSLRARLRARLRPERARKYRTTKMVYGVPIDDDTSAHGESDTTGRYDTVDIESLIRSSNAYCTYKKELLRLVHRPYELRVSLSLETASSVISGSGKVLDDDVRSIAAVAEEISWIPTTLFRWSHGEDLSVVDRLKGLVEDSMGETWNWWPLRPRVRRLSDGFCRLSWQTVCPLFVNFQG
jgi:hypothetical protein